jgi:hypothetical protein
MNIEEVKTLADATFQSAIDEIQETGDFKARFHLIAPEAVEVHVVIDMNDEDEKDAISLHIRKRVKNIHATAVVFLSDVYFKRILDDVLANKIVNDPIMKHRLPTIFRELVQLGLAIQEEALMLYIETPIYRYMARQIYTREGDGTKIILGEKQIEDNNLTGVEGRFVGFFEEAKAATQ